MTRKDDKGKLRWNLLPWCALGEVVRVLEHGASKYGDHNWRTVEPFEERYTNALVRHVVAYAQGEEHDPETGSHHLAHAVCCCLFLIAGPEPRP